MTGTLLIIAYVAVSLGLFVYGANCYVLLALFLRRRGHAKQLSAEIISKAESRFACPESLPLVTTQIPLFNEANVAERVMRAAAAIDYPYDRHEIQVLDDSVDDTREIVDRTARELRAAGHWIHVVRRHDRSGFKAGALAVGMRQSPGEFFAIFDADFLPPANFLRETLPFFFADSKIGLVQGRWGHINASDSLLTRAQAIGIDGHFMIEQSARTFNGLFMNFNGTAGIWRRAAIEDSGGWSADTLTEDLDLSYRAQLNGWRTHFLADLEAPGELPTSVSALKNQQFRWAKGSIQTACKLLPRIWRSDASLFAKLQATLHLTHYAVHPLMLGVALLTLPAMLAFPSSVSMQVRLMLGIALLISMVAPNAMYIVSQRMLYRDWKQRLLWFPTLMCVGVGLAVSNSRAVFEALIRKPSDFVRTPKRGDRARNQYKVRAPVLPWIEVALGAYCLASLAVYLHSGKYMLGPFLVIYAIGFFMIGTLGLWEIRAAAAAARATCLPAPRELPRPVSAAYLRRRNPKNTIADPATSSRPY